MIDAEVTERIVYDEPQLAAFVGSECCDPSAAPKIPTERVAELAEEFKEDCSFTFNIISHN